MIPTTQQNIHTQSTFGGQQVKLSIDAEDMPHIMQQLTDLYSDQALAVVREYSTNAYDSHQEAGTTRPIEVTLPTGLHRAFTVKDYGVGLSVDELVSVYSKYGKSTKRATNEQVGTLGFGCKSGLTYTDIVTITAVKNGVRTLATLQRDSDGSAFIEIIDTSSTDEPSGVEISLSVSNTAHFLSVAERFYRFWRPGTVLVNGVEPKPYSGIWLNDNMLATKELSHDCVVMGNVAYPAGKRISESMSLHIVAYVDIGAVSFPPSREELLYDERTKQTLSELKLQAEKQLHGKIQQEIDAAPTHAEAYAVRKKWGNAYYGYYEYTYRGQKFPSYIQLPEGTYKLHVSNRISVAKPDRLYLGTKYALVTNHTNSTITTSTKNKLRQYISRKQLDERDWLFLPDDLKDPWLEGCLRVKFEDIAAEKLPRKSKAPADGWRIVKSGDKHASRVDKLPAGEIIVSSPALNVTSQIMHLWPESHVLLLERNRWQKLARENKNAVLLPDKLESIRAEITNELTVGDTLRSSSILGTLKRLGPQRIEDPELAKLVLEAQQNKTTTRLNSFNYIAIALGLKAIRVDRPVAIERYPFLELVSWHTELERIYTYINAVWRYTQEEECNTR